MPGLTQLNLSQFAMIGNRRSNDVHLQEKSVINKYDLTSCQFSECFSFAHHNDSSRWFAISSPLRLNTVPEFLGFIICGVAKKVNN